MHDLTPVTFDDLVRMAGRLKVPAVDTAVTQIVAGQIWHLQWDDVSEIGIVTDADDHLPTVAPLQFGTRVDAGSIFVPSFGADAVPLWAHARPVPAVTLAGALGRGELTTQVRTHEPGTDDAAVGAAMDALSGWIDAGDGTGALPALLKASGLPVSHVAKELGADRSTVLDMFRGSFVPGAALAGGLAALLGTTVAAVRSGGAALPRGLRDALTVRRVRDRVKALAGRERVPESRAWFDSAYGTLAIPNRTAGIGDDNWDSRVDRFFEVTL